MESRSLAERKWNAMPNSARRAKANERLWPFQSKHLAASRAPSAASATSPYLSKFQTLACYSVMPSGGKRRQCLWSATGPAACQKLLTPQYVEREINSSIKLTECPRTIKLKLHGVMDSVPWPSSVPHVRHCPCMSYAGKSAYRFPRPISRPLQSRETKSGTA